MMTGKIAEVRTYQRVLTKSEIDLLFAYAHNKYVRGWRRVLFNILHPIQALRVRRLLREGRGSR